MIGGIFFNGSRTAKTEIINNLNSKEKLKYSVGTNEQKCVTQFCYYTMVTLQHLTQRLEDGMQTKM